MINLLDKSTIQRIISEIVGQSEVTRRSLSLRRHKIYKDGGKEFLLEQIRREFDEDAVKEMRLAPINLLKKIVNKRSTIYSRSPIRSCQNANDQKLVEFYSKRLKVDEIFKKANRYYTLDSNTTVYQVPKLDELGFNRLYAKTVPAYLYSISPNALDKCEIEAFIYNSFVESGRIFSSHDPGAPTGREGFSREPGFASNPTDMVASNEDPSENDRQYIFWSNTHHLTTTSQGQALPIPGQEDDNFEHGLERMPVVNITKDRDNEPWALQGEDMVELTLAIQSGWTDLLTISKHQGFATLTVVSENEPKKLVVGLNKAIWLKQNKDGPTPSLDYKSSSADLSSNKDLLMELLGLLLSTNDMNPKSVGGAMTARSFTSGFHALIEQSDTVEAKEEDKPILLAAEEDFWDLTRRWHNKLYEVGANKYGGLDPDAYALGKFSDEFDPQITYVDVQPLESEKDRLDAIKAMRDMGLVSRMNAYKKLNPELTDEQVVKELAEIDQEKKTQMEKMQSMMGDGQAQANPVATNPAAANPAPTTGPNMMGMPVTTQAKGDTTNG